MLEYGFGSGKSWKLELKNLFLHGVNFCTNYYVAVDEGSYMYTGKTRQGPGKSHGISFTV